MIKANEILKRQKYYTETFNKSCYKMAKALAERTYTQELIPLRSEVWHAIEQLLSRALPTVSEKAGGHEIR